MRKTASFPKLRVEPEFRQAVENILEEGESLSSFQEEAIRIQLELRKNRLEFTKRCLEARDKAIATNSFREPKEVHGKLRAMIDKAAKAQ